MEIHFAYSTLEGAGTPASCGSLSWSLTDAPSRAKTRPIMRSLADRQRHDRLAEADDRVLESRSDRRRAQRSSEESLRRLALRLADLKRHQRGRLGLPSDLDDALAALEAIQSAAARERQVRMVRQILRSSDAKAVEASLAASVTPDRYQRSAGPEPAVAGGWLGRLLSEGDAALSELVRRHPLIERGRVRQLMRSARRESTPGPARKRLAKLVEGLDS